MGTQVTIENALLYPDSTHTLLSYKNIHKNELHIISNEKNNEKHVAYKVIFQNVNAYKT
jgi:hypothetical protein